MRCDSAVGIVTRHRLESQIYPRIQNILYYAELQLTVEDIIIIIIWHYNPLWVFAFSAKSLYVLLS